MKFIHTGDLHLGMKISSEYEGKVKERLEEDEKQLLSSIINYANDKNIPYIFIAGDLFDSNKIKSSLVSFVVSSFERYSGRIFIVPGNHDYYSEDSVYAKTEFPSNTHIFKDEITSVETEDAIIYGYGFSAPHCNENRFSGFKAEEKGKVKILITHTDFNTNSFYNPVNTSEIETSGLNYIAAGHIHIKEDAIKKGSTVVNYCGSPQNLKFKETGNSQIISGEISEGFINLSEIDLSCHSFKDISADVTKAENSEDILKICGEVISKNNPDNTLFNLKITGNIKDSIKVDFNEICDKLSDICLYIRIEEAYTVKYNITLLKEENSVRGEFVRQVLSSYPEDENFAAKIIEKGMKYLCE